MKQVNKLTIDNHIRQGYRVYKGLEIFKQKPKQHMLEIISKYLGADIFYDYKLNLLFIKNESKSRALTNE